MTKPISIMFVLAFCGIALQLHLSTVREQHNSAGYVIGHGSGTTPFQMYLLYMAESLCDIKPTASQFAMFRAFDAGVPEQSSKQYAELLIKKMPKNEIPDMCKQLGEVFQDLSALEKQWR